MLCLSLLISLAAGPKRNATLLALADCDAVAAWHDDAFLACHSPNPSSGIMSAYAVRLHAKTGKRVYITQIGEGHAFTAAFRVKVDAQGSAYVSGFTREHAFPTTPDAVQKIYGGGDSDAFLVKVSPKGKIPHCSVAVAPIKVTVLNSMAPVASSWEAPLGPPISPERSMPPWAPMPS